MSDNVAIYPMNVLNVDGFGPESHIHTGFMRALGVHVHEVGNCLDALYLLQSGATFDVIVFNMDMPNAPMAARFLRDVGIRSKLVGFTWDKRNIRTFLHDSLNYCILKPSDICTIDAVLKRVADDYDDE